MRRSERIDGFVLQIQHWFESHKRDLPWRDLTINDDTQRAYQILVSEVMLQQTQVERVNIIYKRFLETFSTVQGLACASNKEVILAWRGMGYNSRALRLRDAAQVITQDYDGVFPRTMKELQSLPGVGHYTAAAIRNFAFHLPTPCIDTNIRRVLHRTFVGPENVDGTWKNDDKYLFQLAEEVLEAVLRLHERGTNNQKLVTNQPVTADWHAALMDYGSAVQTKTNPRWDICPLSKKGLMRATEKNWKAPRLQSQKKQEPGRFVGSTYIPNRIFRGRIVEELRDAQGGLPFNEIGKRVCIDWSAKEHRVWLGGLIKKLQSDRLLQQKEKRYCLVE